MADEIPEFCLGGSRGGRAGFSFFAEAGFVEVGSEVCCCPLIGGLGRPLVERPVVSVLNGNPGGAACVSPLVSSLGLDSAVLKDAPTPLLSDVTIGDSPPP